MPTDPFPDAQKPYPNGAWIPGKGSTFPWMGQPCRLCGQLFVKGDHVDVAAQAHAHCRIENDLRAARANLCVRAGQVDAGEAAYYAVHVDPLLRAAGVSADVFASALSGNLKLPTARGRDLDLLCLGRGFERRRRWSWSPRWLRFWPFWESDRALRARARCVCPPFRLVPNDKPGPHHGGRCPMYRPKEP